MMSVRLIALVVSLTLTGPATASLLCDWACAVTDERGSEVPGGCHDHDTSAAAVAIAAGHHCHELATPTASILTAVPHAELLTAALTASSPAKALTRRTVHAVVRPPGVSNAPPLSVTALRI